MCEFVQQDSNTSVKSLVKDGKIYENTQKQHSIILVHDVYLQHAHHTHIHTIHKLR